MSIVVNVSDLMPVGAVFAPMPSGHERVDVSGLPRNPWERRVRRPNVARLRAAVEAVRLARGGAIISHLPRMSAAVAAVQIAARSTAPHLAFSFNFTTLPGTVSGAYFRRVLDRVDRFCVFSAYEAELYPRRFDLPPERFVRLLWAQDPPTISSVPTAFAGRDYVCAVGGEGRDYATLVAAARLLPHVTVVVIARRYNVVGDLPANVVVLHDVPGEVTWRIAREARALIVPLLTDRTCCGHITLVSAELLGIPVISTASAATREYADDVTTCRPGDAAALASLIDDHHERFELLGAAARARIPDKVRRYSRERWADALRDFLGDEERSGRN